MRTMSYLAKKSLKCGLCDARFYIYTSSSQIQVFIHLNYFNLQVQTFFYKLNLTYK